jgi:putative transposase
VLYGPGGRLGRRCRFVVRLVIFDAHEGLRQAIAKVLAGTTWQRCRVHFMRNLLSTVPKQAQDAVAAIVRSIFSQPDHASAMTQLREVARMLSDRFPQAAELLEDASEDLLAHLHFPREHRRRLHSTNPLERCTRRSSGERAPSGSSRTATR